MMYPLSIWPGGHALVVYAKYKLGLSVRIRGATARDVCAPGVCRYVSKWSWVVVVELSVAHDLTEMW